MPDAVQVRTCTACALPAAVHGSPLSGGYAGAKAAIRFLTRYAATESEREGLGIRFTSVLELATEPGHDRDAYLLTAAGLTPLT
jgi:hypothetical protein